MICSLLSLRLPLLVSDSPEDLEILLSRIYITYNTELNAYSFRCRAHASTSIHQRPGVPPSRHQASPQQPTSQPRRQRGEPSMQHPSRVRAALPAAPMPRRRRQLWRSQMAVPMHRQRKHPPAMLTRPPQIPQKLQGTRQQRRVHA